MLLGALTGLGPVSIDLYLPAFSLIEHELGQGVESTLAAYMFGVAVGQLIYGPVSDRFGRKPPLYVALLLYVVGSMACAFAGGMTQLAIWRFVQALGGCAGIVIARAVVRDRCEPHEAARAFTTLMLITAVAPIVAPVFGGWMVRVAGWRWAFWAQAILGAILLLAIHFILQETHAGRPHPLRLRSVLLSYRALLHNRRFLGHALIGAGAIATLFCFVAGAPTVFTETYGLSPQHFGWLMALNGLGFVVASQLNLRQLRRQSPAAILRKAVWAPLLLGSGSVLLLSFFADMHLALIVALQLGMFIAVGHVAPNVAAEALGTQRGENAGTASAFMSSLQSFGSTLAGAAMAAMNDGSLRTLMILMTVGGVCMVVAYLTLVPKPAS